MPAVLYSPEVMMTRSDPLRLVLLLNVLVLLLAASCQRDRGATWRRIQETGLLSIGIDPTYPPFATLDRETVAGIDPDLGRALAADLGLEASFAYIGYDGLYDALATEQVDLLISALVVRPELTRDFAYSEPYFNAGQVLVVRGASSGIDGYEDLSGRRVAVELGAEGHVVATQWQRRVPDLTVQPFETAGDALEAVRGAAADAAVVDAISARLAAGSGSGLVLSGQPVTEEPFAIVFRIEDELLREAIEESLRRLHSRGELDAILSRWLDGAATQ
jgi:arginine/lysine/histidine transporter system substrate-binding protein